MSTPEPAPSPDPDSVSESTPETEAEMARRSFRTKQRDTDVCAVLSNLGAPTHDEAADVYMPPRLTESIRSAFHAGNRHRGPKLASLMHLRHDIASLYGISRPPPDNRHAGATDVAIRIRRTILAMSEPPPNRHVAYFTHQLRRAFTAAWEAGADETQRCIDEAMQAIRDAIAAAPEPEKPAHYAMGRRVKKELE